MYRQTLDDVRFAVHVEGEKAPATLWRADVACIEELCHLVVHDNLDGCSIVAFVNVFIQVLHGANGGAHMDVDVGLVLLDGGIISCRDGL